jgi:hypothetical protein
VRPVIVKSWVIADIPDAVLHDRTILGDILLDLHTHLPNNLAQYQSRRIPGSPRCFWYERNYSLDPHSFKFRQLRFVVRDSDPSVPDVIYVVIVA